MIFVPHCLKYFFTKNQTFGFYSILQKEDRYVQPIFRYRDNRRKTQQLERRYAAARISMFPS